MAMDKVDWGPWLIWWSKSLIQQTIIAQMMARPRSYDLKQSVVTYSLFSMALCVNSDIW